MEQIRNTDTRIGDQDLVELRSAKLEASSIGKVERALAAAADNLDEAREGLRMFCEPRSDDAGEAIVFSRVLLTVSQVCHLLSYQKTKVYALMKCGLLPYVAETKTGHRRVEYRAVQQLVKRLRHARLEQRVS